MTVNYHHARLAMFEKYCILVVEDTARSLITISSFLKDLGISFKRNTTGARVLEQARTMRPDLIMLNLDLPDADALTVCRKIRRDSRMAHVPVIATTDSCSTELTERLSRIGFSDCLCKPLSRHVVIQMLERHLLRQQSANVFAQSCSE